MARASFDDVRPEAVFEFDEKLAVSVDETRIKQRRANGDVSRTELDALIGGARRVTNFETEIPQKIEHVLGDALAPGRLFVGEKKQQIDVGPRRQKSAAVTPCGNDTHALGVRWVRRPVHVGHRVVENQPDQFVLKARQRGGTIAAFAGCLQLFARGVSCMLDQSF